MIAALKDQVKRHWPRLRLRTIIFATLFVVAALPGFGAIFLRVYENTLVRQTEAELVAQGAALAAAAAALWPGAAPQPVRTVPGILTQVDLSTSPILPERPRPAPADAASPDALAAAARLIPVIRQTQRTTLAGIMLLDRHGRIVTGPRHGSHAALPEVAAALAGTPSTVLRRNAAYRAVYRFEWLSRAAALRIHHAQPIWVNGRVVGVLLLSRSARALFRGLYEDRGKITLGILAILALLVLLSGILSRGVTRPIERLGAATRAVASGHGDIPDVPSTAATEIQGLYADFATMAAAIDHRSRYLRDIAHAISHEFKTPLAGIRGAIELLQDHGSDMDDSDRRRFLANASADAHRLAQLITRLLDLAQADLTTAHPRQSTDIRPILHHLVDAFTDARFRVTLDLSEKNLPVTIPAAALETVLSTLLENSRQAEARHVIITHDSNAMTLGVTDDGNGIAPGDLSRLFDPFFTTRRDAGGTGLGLTIARSLLEAHGGTITTTKAGPGTTFTIALPRL